ncbi:hypothetical protein C900_05531 [Fulvivirga imtechensis AK7]|uniref:RHS repeat-associated core domain-containing protein n=1 Tax=Fulvivirga imtechensis AK7 TaxID=1237149 RepID=L8JL62_9BACT|nr:hypothetical protein C900_05531 [Fulvivirga imtechensis AK7]
MYVYISSESAATHWVYFDDMKVTLNESPVVQEDDYYPFGQTFNSYNRVTAERNKYLYNGKEKIDALDLGWYDYGARNYDASIGRFFNQDRFAEKYLSLNPYQYTANNPILFVDINGDSIRISHKKQELTYLINKDGTSSVLDKNGNAYNGKKNKKGQYKGFVGKVQQGLDDIRNGGDSGNGLVTALHDNARDVTITSGTNETEFKGQNITVSWSSGNTSGGLDINGSSNRPAFIGLGHELAHAYDGLDGQIAPGTWYTNSGGQQINNGEKFASHVENTLRSENGLALRQWYGAAGEGRILQNGSNTQSAVHYNIRKRSYTLPGGNIQRQQSIKTPFTYGTHKMKY